MHNNKIIVEILCWSSSKIEALKKKISLFFHFGLVGGEKLGEKFGMQGIPAL